MTDIQVRELASRLWDKFRANSEMESVVRVKTFEELGISSQDLWLMLAREAAHVVDGFRIRNWGHQ